jgi:hypothetical protein
MDSSTQKWAIGGVALLAAAGVLYYLSQDESQLDPKVHTKEKMLALLGEVKLEYQCMYVRYLNKILKSKKDKEFSGKTLPEFRALIKMEKDEKLETIGKRDEKFSRQVIAKWIVANQTLPEIQQHKRELDDLEI